MIKKNLLFCGFLLVILITVGAGKASAQDAGSPSFEGYDKDPSERVFFTRGDSTHSIIPARKDSSASRMPLKRNVYKPAPVAPKEKNRASDPNDNSVLSFNFLYYLIQKYKMQDIVD